MEALSTVRYLDRSSPAIDPLDRPLSLAVLQPHLSYIAHILIQLYWIDFSASSARQEPRTVNHQRR